MHSRFPRCLFLPRLRCFRHTHSQGDSLFPFLFFLFVCYVWLCAARESIVGPFELRFCREGARHPFTAHVSWKAIALFTRATTPRARFDGHTSSKLNSFISPRPVISKFPRTLQRATYSRSVTSRPRYEEQAWIPMCLSRSFNFRLLFFLYLAAILSLSCSRLFFLIRHEWQFTRSQCLNALNCDIFIARIKIRILCLIMMDYVLYYLNVKLTFPRFLCNDCDNVRFSHSHVIIKRLPATRKNRQYNRVFLCNRTVCRQIRFIGSHYYRDDAESACDIKHNSRGVSRAKCKII